MPIHKHRVVLLHIRLYLWSPPSVQLLSHSINLSFTYYTGTYSFCDSASVNFRYYPLTRRMKQQLFPELWLRGKSGGKKTSLAECLSFCQVLLRPVHNKEMDWQVEKEDREASMIYCLQPRRSLPTPLAVNISKKPKYITPSALTCFTNTNYVICVSLA